LIWRGAARAVSVHAPRQGSHEPGVGV